MDQKNNSEQKALNKSQDEYNKLIEKTVSMHNREVDELKKKGASQQQLLDANRKYLKSEIEITKAIIDKYKAYGNLTKEQEEARDKNTKYYNSLVKTLNETNNTQKDINAAYYKDDAARRIAYNEAKYGSDYKFTSFGRKLYNEYYTELLAYYMQDGAEYNKALNDKITYDREYRQKMAEEQKAREKEAREQRIEGYKKDLAWREGFAKAKADIEMDAEKAINDFYKDSELDLYFPRREIVN
jgi:hypothetical protein